MCHLSTGKYAGQWYLIGFARWLAVDYEVLVQFLCRLKGEPSSQPHFLESSGEDKASEALLPNN